MRWLIIVGVAVIAVAAGLFLLFAEGPQAEPWRGLEELRLFISPDNGTHTVKFSVCGLKILGKGNFYKAGEELWFPIKDIEELPEEMKKDYSDPPRGKATFIPDRDGYVFSFVVLPRTGYGLADLNIYLQESNVTAIGMDLDVSMREVREGGRRYVVFFSEVTKVGSRNATVVFICGGDKDAVLKRAQAVRDELASQR
ncbi:MAG: hypothetical protein ABWK05_02825 [Pyrobaculum sp.]